MRFEEKSVVKAEWQGILAKEKQQMEKMEEIKTKGNRRVPNALVGDVQYTVE